MIDAGGVSLLLVQAPDQYVSCLPPAVSTTMADNPKEAACSLASRINDWESDNDLLDPSAILLDFFYRKNI